MRRAVVCCAALLCAGGLGARWVFAASQTPAQNAPAATQGGAPGATTARPTWSATGQLFESCTCAVPCTCNFGQGPSPASYCHAFFLYKLDTANWNGTDLSGFYFGGVDGPDGNAGLIDDRATGAQREALEALARAVFAKGGPSRGKRSFVSAHMSGTVAGNSIQASAAGHGSFTAQILLGRDRKSPVIVMNNTVWPIPKAIKAKASTLTSEDKMAGAFHASDNNANYGDFQLTSNPPPPAGSNGPATSASPANP